MNTMQSADKHAENLGKLVTNMQALEFVIRSFLVNDQIASGTTFSESASLYKMSEGDIVSVNAFTNYDTLKELIKKYNINQKVLSAGLTIDETLVDVRDAVAHGRVSSADPSALPRLLKFANPKNNQVKVMFSVLMTKEWFGEQIKRFYNAVLKVKEANERLQSGKL